MQYNTYYQKDVWEIFKDEPDKSKLVNELLRGFYATAPITISTKTITKNVLKDMPLSTAMPDDVTYTDPEDIA